MKKKIKLHFIIFLILLWIISGFSISVYNPINRFEQDKTIDPGIEFDPGIESSDTSLNIVATISIIGNVIQNIVGSGSIITTIVSGQEDPHSYEPTPAEVIALREADVVFRMGIEDLEPWWSITASSINSSGDWTPTIVELKEESMLKIDPLLLAEGGAYNPHVWMDPNNIKNFTYKANDTLCSLESTQEDVFSNNTKAYINVLDNLLIQINNSKQELQGLKVVVSHPAFFYLFTLLDMDRVALIEPGEDKEPSAADIANVIDTMEQSGCKLIVYDPQHKSDSAYEIARTTGSELSLLTPLLGVEVAWNGMIKAISTYQEMIEYDLWSLAHPVEPPSLANYIWIYLIFGLSIASIIGVMVYFRYHKSED